MLHKNGRFFLEIANNALLSYTNQIQKMFNMKSLVFVFSLLSMMLFMSCNNSGGGSGAAAANLEGYATENIGGGVSTATKKNASGDIIESGFLLNGAKNGVWITYYEEDNAGSVKSTTSYANGALNGPYFEYSVRGQIDAEVNYLNNQYSGKVAKYKYGRKVSLKHYANNTLNGLSTEFFDNGKIQKETNFKDGKQHGIMTWYNEDGSKVMEYEYSNGEKVSGGIVKGE